MRDRGAEFAYYLDRFYEGRAVDRGACPACDWQPRPEYRGVYYEWRMHFCGRISRHAD